VPAATVMVVEDADRLGLAQLHQLRGRVGRGAGAGLCFLLASAGLAAASPGMNRLEQLAALDDGFQLAEADLAQRGFGDLLGTDQAGPASGGDVADLAQLAELFHAARAEAESIVHADPQLARPEHAPLARALREAGGTAVAGEAG
jgi:ATP-dependent DNA helicase RecG